MMRPIIGECSTLRYLENGEERFTFRGGLLFRRLILSDKFIIKSKALREVPEMLKLFGLEKTLMLLRSGRVHLDSYSPICASSGTKDGRILGKKDAGNQLPLGSFHMAWLLQDTRSNIDNHLSHIFQEMSNMGFGLSHEEQIELEGALRDSLKPLEYKSEDHDYIMRRVMAQWIGNSGLLKVAIEAAFHEILGVRSPLSVNYPKVEQINETSIRADLNIKEWSHLELSERHKIVERALLRIMGLLTEGFVASKHSAIQSCSDQERAYHKELLGHAFEQWRQGAKPDDRDLLRVLNIADVPIYNKSDLLNIDMKAFLEILDSNECVEFRSSLSNLANASELDLNKRFNGFRSKLSNALHSTAGRMARFLVSNVVIPLAADSPWLDLGAGLGNDFGVDWLFPKDGAVAFIASLKKSFPER